MAFKFGSEDETCLKSADWEKFIDEVITVATSKKTKIFPLTLILVCFFSLANFHSASFSDSFTSECG